MKTYSIITKIYAMKLKLKTRARSLFTFFLFITSFQLYAQGIISGKFINSGDKHPFPGATVAVRGTQVATKTATDGSFSIRTSQPDAVLVISSVGFSNVEV